MPNRAAGRTKAENRRETTGTIPTPRRAGALAIFLFAALSGCTPVLTGNPQGGGDSDSLSWGGIHAIDLSEISSGLVSAECTALRTFEDFELAGDADRAVLAASLCEDGSTDVTARPWGRVYRPVSGGGAGWASAGSDYAALSEGGGDEHFRDVTVGISPEGDAAVLAWDAESGASISANWDASSGFGSFLSGILTGELGTYEQFQDGGSSGVYGGTGADYFVDSRDGAYDFIPGRSKGLVWDSRGNVRAVGISAAQPEIFLRGVSDWTSESSGFSTDSATDAGQVRIIDDGLRTTVLWNNLDPEQFDPASAKSVYFASEENGFVDSECSSQGPDCTDPDAEIDQALNPAASGATLAFDAATDGAGTVVVAYIGENGDEISTSCSTLAASCNHRLYASVQSASGTWTGPTPLDDGFTLERATTTYLQSSYDVSLVDADGDLSNDSIQLGISGASAEGGVLVAQPQVAYLGEGRFIVIWALSHYTEASAPYTRIYSRGYSVGAGWDAADEVVEIGDAYDHNPESSSGSTSFTTYRPVNQIKLVADASTGKALLVTQETYEEDEDAWSGLAYTRHYIHAAYAYDPESGWGEKTTFADEIPCPVEFEPDGGPSFLSACGTAPIQAAIFPSGEAVVVFPMPREYTRGDLELGLYSVEYAP